MHLTKSESLNLSAIRTLLHEVKFSQRDKDNVTKRLKNSDIRDISGDPLKGIAQGLSPGETRRYLQKLSEEVGLDEQTVKSLLTVLEATGNGDDDSPRGVLEKVAPRKNMFGYVAAASVSDDAGVDVFYVLYQARVDMKSPACFFACECLKPKTHKKRKESYIETIVYLWLANQVVDELKIEGLTTRGKHKRIKRFKAKDRGGRKTSQQEEESYGSIDGDEFSSVVNEDEGE